MQESLDGIVDIFSKTTLSRNESPKLTRVSLDLKKFLLLREDFCSERQRLTSFSKGRSILADHSLKAAIQNRPDLQCSKPHARHE